MDQHFALAQDCPTSAAREPELLGGLRKNFEVLEPNTQSTEEEIKIKKWSDLLKFTPNRTSLSTMISKHLSSQYQNSLIVG